MFQLKYVTDKKEITLETESTMNVTGNATQKTTTTYTLKSIWPYSVAELVKILVDRNLFPENTDVNKFEKWYWDSFGMESGKIIWIDSEVMATYLQFLRNEQAKEAFLKTISERLKEEKVDIGKNDLPGEEPSKEYVDQDGDEDDELVPMVETTAEDHIKEVLEDYIFELNCIKEIDSSKTEKMIDLLNRALAKAIDKISFLFSDQKPMFLFELISKFITSIPGIEEMELEDSKDWTPEEKNNWFFLTTADGKRIESLDQFVEVLASMIDEPKEDEE